MLNCDWEEVHDFIRRKRDDTADRFSFDKIISRTMDSGVEESQSKDFKHIITNEVSRKPKMKVKAAKVFKYLLNFLQTKPKKFEDQEKLCIPCTPQDSFAYENPESYDCGHLAQMSNSPAHKQDGILSMSWSYLVHDPFKEMPDLEEDTNEIGNEVFYNDSYFEDDYCQDFREKEWTPFRAPAGDIQNVSYNRLFEPERTPYGEYKRSGVTRLTPCKRQASLPNFLVDNPEVSSLAETFEAGPSEDSELVDVDDFMANHPLVGLNIAFDNVLEETNSESVLYSLNSAQFVATEETYQFENNPEQTLNETYTHGFDIQPSDCSENETSSDRTPYNSCIARDSFHKLHDSGQSIQKSDEVVVYNVQSGLQKYTLDTFLPSSCVNKCPPRDQIYMESTGPSKTSKQYGSVESGYSSCESSPSSGSSPETLSRASVDIKSSNSYLLPTNTTEVSIPSACNVLIDKPLSFPNAKFPKTPRTGYAKSAQRREVIETNLFQASTSSPMHIINTPIFLNAIPLPTMNISPIKHDETPKIRPSSLGSDSLKRNRRHRRNECTAKGSYIQSRLLESTDETNTEVTDPFRDDHLLVKAAANVILNRIQFKEPQRYIKMEDLVVYLRSYYMKEIAALSNRNVKSISDFRKITKEACDAFSARRLTAGSSYCELMTGILANRPEIISACEEFIFENHDYFIRSQYFFEAAPEIILMLLCNNYSSIFGVIGRPLRVGDSGHELNTYLEKYIERQRTENSRIYFRVKNMFACIRKKRTDLTKANPVALKVYPEVPEHHEFECGNSKGQAHKGNSSLTSDRSIHSKTPNFQREPLQALCKGTRMFRNKQILFRTQGDVPETTQKLLDYVVDRKTPRKQRSFHQSKMSIASIEDPPEFGRRNFVSFGKYNLLANSAMPSEELNQTRKKSGRSVYASESIYDPKKWTFGRPSIKYVTAV